jgi:tRNA 2-thiouridine synthesizing protein A
MMPATGALRRGKPRRPGSRETKENCPMEDPAIAAGGRPELPEPDAILEVYTRDPATGATCATLTPAIRSRLRAMEPGQVLEVRVDDPAAIPDVTSWSRLSGNPLLATVDADAPVIRFYLRKKG